MDVFILPLCIVGGVALALVTARVSLAIVIDLIPMKR